jgi:hypothetical protein
MKFTDYFGVDDPPIDLTNSNKVYMLFEADGAILPGRPVLLDSAGNTSGRLVVQSSGTALVDHKFVGVYTGLGGSTAPSTDVTAYPDTTDAADGDLIWVQVYGPCTAEVFGTGTGSVDVDAGDALTLYGAVFTSVAADGRIMVVGGADVPGVAPIAAALEDTDAAAAPKAIFVRGI